MLIELVAGYHAASERPEDVGLATAPPIPPSLPCSAAMMYQWRQTVGKQTEQWKLLVQTWGSCADQTCLH